MYYTIYKTTNLINGNFYIGKHQTENLNDSYIGSGYRIKAAKRKYGLKNFKKEILFVFDSEAEMNAKEAELVNEEFCLKRDTYNIAPGGEGGDVTKLFSEERLLLRKSKSSLSTKLMWENMTEEEKSRRGKKTQENTDQKIKGKKVSDARKDFFANETLEAKEKRIQKAKLGSTTIKKKKCPYCDKLLDPGNYLKHVNVCLTQQQKPRKKKFTYILISPNKTVYVTSSLKSFCLTNNLSRYLLLKNVGQTVDKLGDNTSNANHITYSTIGWSLQSMSESES